MTSLKQILKGILMFMTMASLGFFQGTDVKTSTNNITAVPTKLTQPTVTVQKANVLSQVATNKPSVGPITMVTPGSVPTNVQNTPSSAQPTATVTNQAFVPNAPSKSTSFGQIKEFVSKPAVRNTAIGGGTAAAAVMTAQKLRSDEQETEASVSAASNTNSIIIPKSPDLARRSSVKIPSSSSLVDMNKRAPSESLRSSGSGEIYNRPMASSNSTVNGTNYNSNYYSDMGQSRRMDSSTPRNMDGESLMATKPQTKMASSATNNMNNMNGMNDSKTMMGQIGSSMTPKTSSLSPGLNQLKPNMETNKSLLKLETTQPLTKPQDIGKLAQNSMEKGLAVGLEKKLKDTQLEIDLKSKLSTTIKDGKIPTMATIKPLEAPKPVKPVEQITIPPKTTQPIVNLPLEKPKKPEVSLAKEQMPDSMIVSESESSLHKNHNMNHTSSFHKNHGLKNDSSYSESEDIQSNQSKSLNNSPRSMLKEDDKKKKDMTFSLAKESKNDTIQNTVDKKVTIKNTQNKSNIKNTLDASSYQESEEQDSYLNI